MRNVNIVVAVAAVYALTSVFSCIASGVATTIGCVSGFTFPTRGVCWTVLSGISLTVKLVGITGVALTGKETNATPWVALIVFDGLAYMIERLSNNTIGFLVAVCQLGSTVALCILSFYLYDPSNEVSEASLAGVVLGIIGPIMSALLQWRYLE